VVGRVEDRRRRREVDGIAVVRAQMGAQGIERVDERADRLERPGAGFDMTSIGI
jgi:hypothetical protein